LAFNMWNGSKNPCGQLRQIKSNLFDDAPISVNLQHFLFTNNFREPEIVGSQDSQIREIRGILETHRGITVIYSKKLSAPLFIVKTINRPYVYCNSLPVEDASS
jgi:hypothetical protein